MAGLTSFLWTTVKNVATAATGVLVPSAVVANPANLEGQGDMRSLVEQVEKEATEEEEEEDEEEEEEEEEQEPQEQQQAQAPELEPEQEEQPEQEQEHEQKDGGGES